MQTLAHYALLGSLVAGGAGVLVLSWVTYTYGVKRRACDEEPDTVDAVEAARRQRTVRLADAMTVVCFALAAGLAVIAVMPHARVLTAFGVDDAVAERLQALERRVAAAEVQHTRPVAVSPDPRPLEARMSQLEHRLSSVEDRAARAEALSRERREERARTAPVSTPRRVSPSPPTAKATPSPAPSPAPSASPRIAPQADDIAVAPDLKAEATSEPKPDVRSETAAPPAPLSPSPPIASIAPPSPPPAPPKPRTHPPIVQAPPAQTPAPEPSLVEKMRSDWEAVKRATRKAGDQWVDGWRELRRLFD